MFPLYYFFLILILAYSAIKSMIAIDESKNESTYENFKHPNLNIATTLWEVHNELKISPRCFVFLIM